MHRCVPADAANGRAVSAESLGLTADRDGASSSIQNSAKIQKESQLANEVAELIRSLRLQPSVVTRSVTERGPFLRLLTFSQSWSAPIHEI
jgi:hypothetical protein